MYSVVLLAAMTAGGQTPAWNHCNYCGGGYGGCYGNYGVDSWNCYGGGYGGGYGGYGSCTGTCWGGYGYGCDCSGGYPWDWSTAGCTGTCWGGSSGVLSPYFPQAAGWPPVTTPPTNPPANPLTDPTVKPGEQLPPPMKPGDAKPPEAVAPTRGRLIVDVPAGAQLYVDDTATKTQAEHRTFQTPDLEPGQTYYYDVRVEAQRDGKPVSVTRRVLVRAGQETHADFTDLTTTATAQAK